MANRKTGIPGLGARLRRYREAIGLTAAVLASSIEERFPDTTISRQVVFNIESGRKRDIGITELVQLASTLGVSPTALLCDFGRPFDKADEGPFKGMDAVDVLDMFSSGRQYPDFLESVSNLACREDLAMLYKALDLNTITVEFFADLDRWQRSQSKALHPSMLAGDDGKRKEAIRDLIVSNTTAMADSLRGKLQKATSIATDLKANGIELPDELAALLKEIPAMIASLDAQASYRLKNAGLDDGVAY